MNWLSNLRESLFGVMFNDKRGGKETVLLAENRADIPLVDKAINSLNRLWRPLACLAVFAFAGLSYIDTPKFAEVAIAWGNVPTGAWGIAATVIGFWFVSRAVSSNRYVIDGPAEQDTVVGGFSGGEIALDDLIFDDDDDPEPGSSPIVAGFR